MTKKYSIITICCAAILGSKSSCTVFFLAVALLGSKFCSSAHADVLESESRMGVHVPKIVIRKNHQYYKNNPKFLGLKDIHHGTISYTQRFGSALNLNQHIHCLVLDGVFSNVAGIMRFHNTPSNSDQEAVTQFQRN
jgi:hypothetical protein